MLYFIGNVTGVEFVILSLAYILASIVALIMHEFAHAFCAYKSGDATPKIQGRVSINPLKHMDPIGFLCCALFGFGWAKPVQINQNNFRNIKRGIAWTSVAGVLMNLFISFIAFGLFRLSALITIENYFFSFLQQFLYFVFFINLCLAVFNFLPIYPLDGFKFVESLTKYNNGYVKFMYKYGNLILVLLLVFFREFLATLINYIGIPIMLFWNMIFG